LSISALTRFTHAFGGGDVATVLVRGSSPEEVQAAAEEVGTLGYLSGLPMADRPGLISEGASAALVAALAGRPSRVRWAVLAAPDMQQMKRLLAPFRQVEFGEGGLSLTVVDLRAGGSRQ